MPKTYSFLQDNLRKLQALCVSLIWKIKRNWTNFKTGNLTDMFKPVKYITYIGLVKMFPWAHSKLSELWSWQSSSFYTEGNQVLRAIHAPKWLKLDRWVFSVFLSMTLLECSLFLSVSKAHEIKSKPNGEPSFLHLLTLFSTSIPHSVTNIIPKWFRL